MVAARRQGGPGAHSWDYSNADSFSDDMFSNLTLYDAAPSSSTHPHYATLPRGSRRPAKPKQYGPEAPPPYAAMEMLLEDYDHEQHRDADSGYSSGAASPEPHDCPPSRQLSTIHHGITQGRRKGADYYWLLRPSPQPSFEHGLGADPTSPSICFVCTMQPAPKTKKKSNRRITNNDISKPDADPVSYIKDNCEGATRALSSHRRLHNCDCDFAYLDGRKRSTANCWRRGDQGELLPPSFGPRRPCRRRWYTGFFVRQHMKFHDQYCGCGCFGQKLSSLKTGA